MKPNPILVIIVDDHPCVCNALRRYLTSRPDIKVVGTAATGDKGLELAITTHPDVAIVDLHLPHSGQGNPTPSVFSHGIRLISTLHQQLPDIAILALTGLLTPVTGQAALRAGAHQCLSKNCQSSEIADAIRAVNRGEVPEKPENQDAYLEPMQSLTGRELEILHLINHGLTNQQIASQLTISPLTVHDHLKHVYAKLGVSCRVEATLLTLA